MEDVVDRETQSDAPALVGKVAVVAGASRGVGRGIALGLGEAGASVVATGRSTRFGKRTDRRNMETVEDTAEDLSALGGDGTPYVIDHLDAAALHDLSLYVLRRIGPPDVLALSIWGGNETYDGERFADGSRFGAPIWSRSPEGYERAIGAGAYAALKTLHAFVPMMKERGGLLVFIGFDGEGAYLGDPFYDLGKAAMLRLMQVTAQDLAGTPLTACHLSPGFVATERVSDAGLAAETTETPLYAGRAVAALAADPERGRHHGRSLFVADLAREYGFCDEDGTQPERFRLEEG